MIGYLPNSFAKPGSFTVWRSGVAESGNGAYFNSALSTIGAGPVTNARLTIYVRLLLLKRGKESPKPIDGDKKAFQHRDWDDRTGEFEKFRSEVKRQTELFWNNTGFCIVPPRDYRGLDYPPNNPTLHLNVDCRFEVVWASGKADAHAVVECYRIDSDKDPGFRSFCDYGDDPCRWTNFDVVPSFCHDSDECRDRKVKGKLIEMIDGIIPVWEEIPAQPQIAVVHEMGHLLGLPHVSEFVKNADCLRAMAQFAKDGSGQGGNDPTCYKGNNEVDRLNIMGEGMNLAVWNGLCWWRRLAEHTGTTLEGWRVRKTWAIPQRLAARAAAGAP